MNLVKQSFDFYVGCCSTRTEAALHCKVLRNDGIQARWRRLTHSYDRMFVSYTLWASNADDAAKARDFRKGFKAALTIRHSFEFVLGARSALLMRGRQTNRSDGLR